MHFVELVEMGTAVEEVVLGQGSLPSLAKQVVEVLLLVLLVFGELPALVRKKNVAPATRMIAMTIAAPKVVEMLARLRCSGIIIMPGFSSAESIGLAENRFVRVSARKPSTAMRCRSQAGKKILRVRAYSSSLR